MVARAYDHGVVVNGGSRFSRISSHVVTYVTRCGRTFRERQALRRLYGDCVTSDAIVAWEWSNTFANDSVHGLGALITSPATAGFAALGAAVIAARQVARTRADDKAIARSQERWARFEWVSERKGDLGVSTRAELLLLLETDAKANGDDELSNFIAAIRRRTISQASAKARQRGNR